MDTNAKIINKILASEIKQHIERITQHDQVEYIPGIQGGFNVWKIDQYKYTTLTEWRKKTLHDHLNDAEKKHLTNSMPFHYIKKNLSN